MSWRAASGVGFSNGNCASLTLGDGQFSCSLGRRVTHDCLRVLRSGAFQRLTRLRIAERSKCCGSGHAGSDQRVVLKQVFEYGQRRMRLFDLARQLRQSAHRRVTLLIRDAVRGTCPDEIERAIVSVGGKTRKRSRCDRFVE